MEKVYLDPDEVRSKFRSKYDLWKRLSIDCEPVWLLIDFNGYLSSKLFKMINSAYEANTR